MFSCCWVAVELLKEREKLNYKHICLLISQCNAMDYTVLQYRDQLQTALAAVVHKQFQRKISITT